ncbi:MAG: hypothetical protein LBT75_02945 [Bacilli bacterium]|nr:hypothetical protein [Bacilli bacterium]
MDEARYLALGHVMINLVSNFNYRRFINEFLLGTHLSSYLFRMVIYAIALFLDFTSFNNFFQTYIPTNLTVNLTVKESLGWMFSPYLFNQYTGSDLLFLFLLESVNIIINAIKYKYQVLFYRVGRTNDYFKKYVLYSLRCIILSTAIIFLACIIDSTILVIINYFVTNDFMLFDSFYFEDMAKNLNIIKIIPFKFRVLSSYIILGLPAFISVVYIYLYSLFFYEKIKNSLLTLIFLIFIYIINFNIIFIFGHQYLPVIPVYPIMNIQSVGPVWASYLSILIQSFIVASLFIFRKKLRWDEI